MWNTGHRLIARMAPPLRGQGGRQDIGVEGRDPGVAVLLGESFGKQVGGQQFLEQHGVEPDQGGRGAEVAFLVGRGEIGHAPQDRAGRADGAASAADDLVDVADGGGAHPVVVQCLGEGDGASMLPVFPTDAPVGERPAGEAQRAGLAEGGERVAFGSALRSVG